MQREHAVSAHEGPKRLSHRRISARRGGNTLSDANGAIEKRRGGKALSSANGAIEKRRGGNTLSDANGAIDERRGGGKALSDANGANGERRGGKALSDANGAIDERRGGNTLSDANGAIDERRGGGKALSSANGAIEKRRGGNTLSGRTFFRMLLALGLIALSAADPALSKAAIGGALERWAHSVVPALLPFLIAVPALTCPEACALLSGATRPVMRLIGCPDALGAAWLSGLLSGSPAGALAAARASESVDCDEGALLRAAVAASGASPAFLVGVAGEALGGAGWRLALAQALGGLMTALLMRPLRGRTLTARGAQSGGGSAVMGAARALIMIAACMALFSLPAAWGAHLFGENARGILLMLLELTGGCETASHLPAGGALKSALMSAVCCLGGASVCAQCLGILRPTGVSGARYIYWKLVHAALSALVMLALTALPERALSLRLDASAFVAALGALTAVLGVASAAKRHTRGAAPK